MGGFWGLGRVLGRLGEGMGWGGWLKKAEDGA